MKQPLVRFTNVSFTYARAQGRGGWQALRDVNLEVFEHEFVAVLGRNGSGKSTLAKHVNALLTPTSGQVLVAGLDTSVPENVWEIRQKVGMVFQNLSLIHI